MPVERYMALCLAHPVHGYYVTRDPLGAAGDFTTAPEISQMFGELVGLWAAGVWSDMGAPATVRLVELGPGRGTLMRDALRAARVLPAFLAAVRVHLVETSPALRARQGEALAGVEVAWHERLEEVPEGPAIVVANEFFDALPVRQFVRAGGAWRERLVGLTDDGALAFGLAPEPERTIDRSGPEGAVLEWPAIGLDIARALAARLAAQGGAALAIDYGHLESGFGDTLQALRRHAPADPLADPGEADLTTHVDFAALARAARAGGTAVHGPVTQGAFLRALGIEARAAILKRRATPAQAEAIDAALARLVGTGPEAMGGLFKAIGFAHPALPPLPGFPPA
ncbi:class I SAM-dependent methyltransferase [Salinarimonas soli]|uniref:Class I SAM-dependent methyltransferase n=2 Tax=Salinarimonas soli TaxID=1638099 RepID=A0A5B2VUA1_9HYPH|nr:class I SAM-dependent methyltransferase [Salinarimonas soli]